MALGYSQIPGVDYTDNFAPVAHEVSFRIALARMMVEKLDSLVMDVETAFIYGDIEEEIFMKSPIGMEEIDPGSSPEVHLKAVYKVIRHVLSTKGYGLKFELRKDMIKWALKALSDSDFASDKETRISVFRYIIYFCGIPIAWRSKGMKSVVLSTTEAE